jgi:hypothetical protein
LTVIGLLRIADRSLQVVVPEKLQERRGNE